MMKDINNQDIIVGATVEDTNGNKYLIIEKNSELYAQSLFSDAGCGSYILYQDRIIRNGFKII